MSSSIAFPRIPPDLFQRLQAARAAVLAANAMLVRETEKLAVARASMLLMSVRLFEYQKRLAEASGPAVDELITADVDDRRIDRGVQRSERIAPSEQDDVNSLLAILELYLRNAGIISKLRAIISDETATLDAKLRRLDETLPIPDEMTAVELAHVFRVTRQAVSKTSWWKQRRRRPDDVDERLRRLRVKGRGIDPDSFDDDAALAG